MLLLQISTERILMHRSSAINGNPSIIEDAKTATLLMHAG
jgi:hypothetical protein